MLYFNHLGPKYMNTALLHSIIEKHWLHLTLILLAVISFLSLKPVGITTPAVGFDKLYHCLAYTVLVMPLALKRPTNWQLMVAVLMLYSGAIELVQPMIGRHGEWLDFAMNACGLLIGVVIASTVRHRQIDI